MPATDEIDLDALRIASPCPARWEDMEGDDRVRHCADCGLSVYNTAGLSRAELVAFVRAREGERLCLRLVRRADGTVLVRDCPVGLAAVRRRLASWLAALGALLLCAVSFLGWRLAQRGGGTRLPVVSDPEVLLGEVCVPPPGPGPRSAAPRSGG